MLYVLLKKVLKNNSSVINCYIVVLGGGLAPTRSYSERWQVARSVCVAVVVCSAKNLKLSISGARRRPFVRIVLLQELEKSKIGFWSGA